MPYSCPLCGVTSNRKGRSFETTQQVESHIDAKRDDVHAGESAADHRADIEHVDEAQPAESAGKTRATDGGATTAQQTGDADHTGRETVDLTPDELDQMIQDARDDGYETGYQDGKQKAPSDEELEEVWNDGYQAGCEDAKDEVTGQQSADVDDPDCPKCGADMYDFTGHKTGESYSINGRTVHVQGDYQCSSCTEWFVDE